MVDANGDVQLVKSYRPYGETLYSGGNGDTNYGFTGEWTLSSTNLIYLRARYYVPAIGRFLSKDTWKGDSLQVMSFNRWLYSNGNPLIYIDPTGYKPFIILACGMYTDGACENGKDLKDYNNQVPLEPFSKWADQEEIDKKYFDYSSYDDKEKYAKNIRDFMENKMDSEFILVGHSAGADVIIWAANLYIKDYFNPRNVLGIMALDMDLSKDIDDLYTQNDIDRLKDNGIPVSVFRSTDYKDVLQPEDFTEVKPNFCTNIWLFWKWVTRTGLSKHKYLSVDQAGFDKYMKPVLESWINK
jgi:RHS repeat-associated protein